MNVSIENTKLYKLEDYDKISINEGKLYKTKITTTNETTLGATKRLHDLGYTNIACLNFASAKHPEGGFLKGSPAQEECLCRESGLYSTIFQDKVKEMYEVRLKSNALYINYAIFSPDVPVFRDSNFNFLENYFKVSVITSAAPNAGVYLESERYDLPKNKKIKDIEKIMYERIKSVLLIAIDNIITNLVLGAFGCEVFKNDPYKAAYSFKKLLYSNEFKDKFENIVFAIYDKNLQSNNYKVFKGILG